MSSKTTRSLIAAILSAFLLTACGGGGGSSSGGDGAGSVDRGPQGDIEGQAVKGVVKNGVVGLYAIVNGYIKAEPLATTLTDDQGRYAINYNGDYQGVALLKLSVNKEADQVTRMTCDIKPDCGVGTSFGEDFVLEEGFFLHAAIAEVNTGTKLTVNINALTDLAAAYSLPPNQYPDDVSAVSIQQANQDIAELFGMSGSILTIPTTDITHADLVAAADNIAVKNALFSSAILAVLQADTELGLVERLRNLRELYINNDGSFLTERINESDTIIFDILNASEALAEQIGVKAEIMTAMLQYKNSIDSDGDGLGDLLDAFPHNPNWKYDKDKDGVGDSGDGCDDNPEEFIDSDGDGYCNLSDAFPNNRSEWSDSDEDGIGDNSDICPHIPNLPGQLCEDVDLDRVADSDDNCPTIPNPDQADNYGTSFGDACEDTDGDRFYDNADNCPLVVNEDQNNNVNKATPAGDACEDSDADSIEDSIDNCPFVKNENQEDFDGSLSSKGDACEDSDGDGFKDDVDVYPTDATLSGIDSDGDDVDDLVDAFPNDPTKWDPSPFTGRYKISGDTTLVNLGPPDVTVTEAGHVDWNFMGYRVVFDVNDDGTFFAVIPGIGSMSGRIGSDGSILGNYSALGLNGILEAYRVSP